jgi:hypothetical protein
MFLKKGCKLRLIAKLTNRSVSLKVEYHVSLVKVSIHLVSLQEFQETSFLIVIHVDEYSAKFKTKKVKSWPTYISNIIHNFLDILIDDLPKHLPPFRNVDHKIKVVFGSTPPSKSPS